MTDEQVVVPHKIAMLAMNVEIAHPVDGMITISIIPPIRIHVANDTCSLPFPNKGRLVPPLSHR